MDVHTALSFSLSSPVPILRRIGTSRGLYEPTFDRKDESCRADDFPSPTSPYGLESTSLSSSSSRAMSSWSEDQPGEASVRSPLMSDGTPLSRTSGSSPPPSAPTRGLTDPRGQATDTVPLATPLRERADGQDRATKRKSTSPPSTGSLRKRPASASRTQSATTLTPLMTIKTFPERPSLPRALTSIPIQPIELESGSPVNSMFTSSSLPTHRHPSLMMSPTSFHALPRASWENHSPPLHSSHPALRPPQGSSSALGLSSDYGYEALASVMGLDLAAPVGPGEQPGLLTYDGQSHIGHAGSPGPSNWSSGHPPSSALPDSAFYNDYRPAHGHPLPMPMSTTQSAMAYPSSYPGGGASFEHAGYQPSPPLPGVAFMDPSRLLASPTRRAVPNGPVYLPSPSALIASAGLQDPYASTPMSMPVSDPRAGGPSRQSSFVETGATITNDARVRPSTYQKVMRYNYPEKQFKCLDCPQSFSRNHDLKRHQKIHLAVRPFACTNCGKDFTRKDALRRHLTVKGDCGRVVELPKSAAKLRREEAARCKALGLPPPPKSPPAVRPRPQPLAVDVEDERDEERSGGSGSGSGRDDSDGESDDDLKFDPGQATSADAAFLGGALSPLEGQKVVLPSVASGYQYPSMLPPPFPPHHPQPAYDPSHYLPHQQSYETHLASSYPPSVYSPHILPPIQHHPTLDPPHQHPWSAAPAAAFHHPPPHPSQPIYHPQPQHHASYAPYPEAGLDEGARVMPADAGPAAWTGEHGHDQEQDQSWQDPEQGGADPESTSSGSGSSWGSSNEDGDAVEHGREV